MAFTIVEQITKRTGLPEEAVQKTLDALRETIVEQSAIGESTSVRGIFTVNPIRYRQFSGGKIINGYTAKIKPSKTLLTAVEQAAQQPENLVKAKENSQSIEEAMKEAGISLMELPSLV